MTSIIKFTPLSGGLSQFSAHAYILEVDTFTFLLDCGWEATFPENYLNAKQNPCLRSWVGQIDAVLLSYPDLLHLGGLPYAVGKLGLQCPIYATVPVYKMGQMFLYDAFQARHNNEDFDLFTLDEVDKAFEMMTQLKYNQSVSLTGKGAGITITPMPAGHMIGGTVWKILKDGEEDIIYAVDFNHKKEQHLNGCDIERIYRPSLLITDARNFKQKQTKRRERDESMMTNILQTLRNNGNVLICVDTAGRVLELAYMIDHMWHIQDSGLLAYSVALLNNVGFNVIEFAKSQIEWMSEKLMRNFEGRRNNPFQFKHLKLCHNMSEVNKVPSPKVVLASMPDLESGFSRDLFTLWCENPRNCVIVTNRNAEGTLASQLVKNIGKTDWKLTLEIKKRIKLTGKELEDHKRMENAKKSTTAMEEDDESSDDEMEVVTQTTGGKKTIRKHDIIMRNETSDGANGAPGKQSGFFKSNKTKFPMFPFHEEKIRWDDYGEIIKPEEWMDTSTDQMNSNPENGPGDSELKTENQAAPADGSEVPTKCVVAGQTLRVKCKVLYMDFEGQCEGESMLKVINAMKPRRTIVVHGTEENCKSLANFCTQVAKKAGDAVTHQTVSFVGKNGECIDATTESYIYQVRLPESLVNKLDFGEGKDGMVAWVDGVVSFKEQSELMKDLTTEDDRKALIPSLLPLPEEDIPGHQATLVNELKLSDFKLILQNHGIPSEFIGGVLFCGQNSNIALKRHDSGRVTMEGTVSEDYYSVREILYQQYAIV